jgi:hypothetical protein
MRDQRTYRRNARGRPTKIERIDTRPPMVPKMSFGVAVRS